MSPTSADHKTSERVVHNYVDRSHEADPEPATTTNNNGNGSGNMDHTFPLKLHYMLSSIEADGQSNVVSWQPHGRCFMVHDLKEFVASMLPLWFRQSKFASFQRQLNLYGFQRLTQGRDKGAYYHEYFLRGRPLLAQKIIRTKVKGKGARKASSPDTEPRFYELPFMKETKTFKAPNKENHQNQLRGAGDDMIPLQVASATNASIGAVTPTPPPSLGNASAPAGLYSAGLTDPFWASAIALSKPNLNLGEALGLLSFDQLTASQQNTASQSFLSSFSQNSNHHAANLFNSLLSTNWNHNLPSLTGSTSSSSTTSSMSSGSTSPHYVPIAPAPPSMSAGSKNDARAVASAAATFLDSSSVLAAIKAQAARNAPHPQQQGAPAHQFTIPGPSPF